MSREVSLVFGAGAETPVVLAHRGGKGPWRENTLDAFSGAVEMGADGVELDVRLSRDGCVVVHHDPLLEGVGEIHELTRRELPPWIADLDDALAACAGAFVNVEVKISPLDSGVDSDEKLCAGVVAELTEPVARQGDGARKLLSSLGGVVVSSFSPYALALTSKVARGFGVHVPTGLLVHPATDPRAALETGRSLGCVALHVFHSRATRDLVDRVHDSQMAVLTWTVNSPEDLSSVLEAGVDGVVTDDVLATLAFLGRRVAPKRGGGG